MSIVTKAKLPCPKCPSSDAFHKYDDGHGYCYSCKYFEPAEGQSLTTMDYTYEYLPWRGVDRASYAFFDAKTKVDVDGKPVELGFKYPNGTYKVRYLDRKDFTIVGNPNDPKAIRGEADLFGRDRFAAGSHKYVTITEGELDAISLWQVVRSPVVSVQSASSAIRDCNSVRSWLDSFERIYLAFDADAVGQNALRGVARLFDNSKVYVLKFSNRKDANEYVANGESNELLNIWKNAKKYSPVDILSAFSEFEKVLRVPMRLGVPYPFPTLTNMTYGIRRGESVLIKAQEKVGKTELMHAIEYQLLKETDDAIGAIYLEEPKKRHLQALAGLELGRPVHLPDVGCTDDEIVDALRKVIRRDDRLHLYSHFGSDDPDVVLDTIRYLVTSRECAYVMLDHVSMVVSGLAGDDERKALDYIATRIEMMVKELDFSLIWVSHVNDFGQTRGSRYLTKVSDITIDASRDLLNADPVIRNTMKLVIPYNRFSGRSGPAGNLLFDPTTYTLKEVSNGQEADNDNIPCRIEELAA